MSTFPALQPYYLKKKKNVMYELFYLRHGHAGYKLSNNKQKSLNISMYLSLIFHFTSVDV